MPIFAISNENKSTAPSQRASIGIEHCGAYPLTIEGYSRRILIAHAPKPPSPSMILLPTHEFHPKRGGIAVYVEETARAGVALGSEWQVFAGGPTLSEPKSLPFAYEPIPNRGSLNWPDLWKTAAFLRQRRKAIEEATLCLAEPGPIFTYIYDLILHLPRPRKLVLVLHGSEILRLAAFPHRRAGFKRLLQKADRIGVVSRYAGELLERHFAGHTDRTFLVPGALRSTFRPPAIRTRPWTDSSLRVLTVARLHPRKGFFHVIRALGRLPDDLRNRIVYEIVCPENNTRYAQQLAVLAKRNQVLLQVTHNDRNLKQIYADADIFAMTSESHARSVESFGLVYLEAGASGLPVIAHETGGVAEAVCNGISGLLVKPGNSDGLTAAFQRLLSDPGLRRQLGEGGRKVADSFSWSRNIETLFPEEIKAHADSLREQ